MRRRSLLVMGVACVLVAAGSTATFAQSQRPVQEQQTRIGNADQAKTRLDASDQATAQMWGLNADEMQRAKVLLQGPRAAFSVPNLSPLEALGIHARNEAERNKYAEMMAKIVQSDVQRSILWNNAFQQAQLRLFGVQTIVDYSGLPKANASIGAADAMNVPRSLLNEPGKDRSP